MIRPIQRQGFAGRFLFMGLALACSAPNHGGDEKEDLLTAREDRRDSFTQHQLTPWLTVSDVIESDFYDIDQRPFDGVRTERDSISETAIELVLEAALPLNLDAEIVYAFDGPTGDHQIEEVVLSAGLGKFDIDLGRTYVPFGKHFNNFVSGPISEFSETLGNSLIIEYSPINDAELSVFTYRGNAKGAHGAIGNTDWGASADFRLCDSLSLGASYLSDLADGDERLLDDFGGWQQRVDAVSGFMLFTAEDWQLSVEAVRALRGFSELPPEFDRPTTLNSELAFALSSSLETAIRVEQSHGLLDAPARRYGAALIWTIPWADTLVSGMQAGLSVEYLWNRFARGSAETELENELREESAIGAQLALSF